VAFLFKKSVSIVEIVVGLAFGSLLTATPGAWWKMPIAFGVGMLSAFATEHARRWMAQRRDAPDPPATGRPAGTASRWDYCGAGRWIRHGGWALGGPEGYAAEVSVREREPFIVRVRRLDGAWLPDLPVRGRAPAFDVADALLMGLGWTCDREDDLGR
jgi:hypothetical protein